MKKTRNPVFIVELLLLFVILLLLITVITKTFMASRSQSLRAKHLSEAVVLAEEAAEVSNAAKDIDEAVQLFDGLDQVRSVNEEGGTIELQMDFTSDDGSVDDYRVVIDIEEEKDDFSVYSAKTIDVYYGNVTDPVYTLTTGSYKTGD